MKDESTTRKSFLPIRAAFQNTSGFKMSLRSWANEFLTVILAAAVIASLLPVDARATQKADGIPRMTIQELKGKMDSGDRIVILDVRTAEDYSTSPYKIRGAIRIPLDELKSRYTELPAAAEIVTYCA